MEVISSGNEAIFLPFSFTQSSNFGHYSSTLKAATPYHRYFRISCTNAKQLSNIFVFKRFKLFGIEGVLHVRK